MMNLSIVGYGYVGSAMGHLCEKNNISYNVCDVSEKSGPFNYFKKVSDIPVDNNLPHYIVVAVPTPSDKDGNCDTSIVTSVLSQITPKDNTYIIIKSTVVPGTCKKLHEMFPELNIVFCPEFLREISYKEDMYNSKFILFGLPPLFNQEKTKQIVNFSKELYKHNQDLEVVTKSYEECEMFKYTLNVYFSVKIWYFNEIYQISQRLGVDYQSLKELFKFDSRIGDYGTSVPGYDGKLSFGGSCLPKETRGMIKLQENLDIPNDVLKTLLNRSTFLREL
jgi:UDPglucose 6-dehydrogenase